MRSYIKFLVYYLLGIVDSILNFLCSFFFYYPGIDLANSFLAKLEVNRVMGIINERNDARLTKMDEAETTIKRLKDDFKDEQNKKKR